MRFAQVSVEDLLQQFQEAPSEWLDEAGRETIHAIEAFLAGVGNEVDPEKLDALLAGSPRTLDVIRLFLGLSQDEMANRLRAVGGDVLRGTYASIRERLKHDRVRAAVKSSLVRLQAVETINEHLRRPWTIRDVLLERYRFGRGRAVKGQSRGRSLEDEVERRLRALGVPYLVRVTFVGRDGKQAKADFAIPGSDHPKIIIESKAYEATGSKQTDVLGDIRKIVEAREFETYFFVVTDGLGWHNRVSDLRRLVDFHQRGWVTMIYTRATLAQLQDAVKYIYEYEYEGRGKGG